MMHRQTLLFGLVGGLLFFAHAMINNSHAWPLIWPALAGALAVWTARTGTPPSYSADIKKAASVGLVAGLVFLFATAIALSQLGVAGAGLIGLAIAAAIGLLAAVIAGALVHPVAGRA
jgi:hypothetical protein